MAAQTATAMQTTKETAPAKHIPADLFGSISDAITRRAFELFESNGRWFGRDLENWFRAESELLHPLPLEVKESDEEFMVRAEVPGFTAKDLEISLEPNNLKIAGRRESTHEEKKGKTLRSEFCTDQILRSVDLPCHVDTGKANATLRDGILTIEIPKAPHAKAVHIEARTI